MNNSNAIPAGILADFRYLRGLLDEHGFQLTIDNTADSPVEQHDAFRWAVWSLVIHGETASTTIQLRLLTTGDIEVSCYISFPPACPTVRMASFNILYPASFGRGLSPTILSSIESAAKAWADSLAAHGAAPMITESGN